MTDEDIKSLIQNYKPSPEIVATAKAINMVATVGPSASGKSSVMRKLAAQEPGFKLAIGESNRPLRMNEGEFNDMVFRPKEEILKDLQLGKLFQIVVGPNGNLYCTRPEDFFKESTNLYPLIPPGVRQFRALPLKFFAAAFIVPASYELWQTWLNNQAKLSNWTGPQLAGRLAEARSSYEFALGDAQIKFVLNDDLDKAAHRLLQVAQGHAPDDEALARQTAQANYHELITHHA